MATFAKAKNVKQTRPSNGALKLSVGKSQILDTVSIDYKEISQRKWVVSIVDADQFGLQIHAYPLHIEQPEGLVVFFVDEKGQPIPNQALSKDDNGEQDTSTNDDAVEMAIEDGETVVKTLNAYIADAPIVEREGNYPTNVHLVEAVINPSMLE